MCKKFLLGLLVTCFCSFLCSEEVSSSDTLAMINAQALLGQNIVTKLAESLSLREARIAESELDLSLRETDYEQRMAELAVRETDLNEREKRSTQIERISNDLTKSLTKLENSQKFTNGLLIGTAVLATLEGILILVR